MRLREAVKIQARQHWYDVESRTRGNPYRQALERFTADIGTMAPDTWRYHQMAQGEGAPRPYHYRWLLPRLLGTDRKRWSYTSQAAVVAMVPAMRWLTGKWSPGLFVFTLHGVWGNVRLHPGITDPVAMLAAIVAAGAVLHRRWGVAVTASLVAGASKESAPLFAAVYASHPLPLVGLLSPAVMATIPAGPDIDGDDFSHQCVTEPAKAVWKVREDTAQDWRLYVAPWGGLLAGVIGDRRTVAALVLAYGQLLLAVDTNRLTAWAWPVLADNATDRDWWPLALAGSYFNPWRVAR